MTIELLEVADIQDKHVIQLRAEMSQQAIEDYAEAYRRKSKGLLPPIVVFRDEYDSKTHTDYVVDGGHRLAGARLAGLRYIEADILYGRHRDALLYACGCNARHGLRRTPADKRLAVQMLLGDPEWSKKSARWIADKCQVSHPFVAGLRSELETLPVDEKRVGRDGKVRGRKQSAPASVSASAPDSAPASSFDWPDDEPAAPLAQALPADPLPTVVEPTVVESVGEPVAPRLSKNAIRQLHRFDNALRDCYLKLERVNVPIRHPVKSALSVAWEAYRALHKAIETERNQ